MVAESKVVDTIREVIPLQSIADATYRLASDSEVSDVRHLNDFVHPENFILSKQADLDRFGLIRGHEL